jgi:hypothetical protein
MRITINPIISMRLNCVEKGSGKNPDTMRAPSSGGIGTRLKITTG